MTPEQAKKELLLITLRKQLEATQDPAHAEYLAKRIKEIEVEMIQGAFKVRK